MKAGSTRKNRLTSGEVLNRPADFPQGRACASEGQRLPALKEGRLVGIVTRGDLVRAFARPDSEIVDDIRREVMLHLLWMSPHEVDVEVRGVWPTGCGPTAMRISGFREQVVRLLRTTADPAQKRLGRW